MPRAARRRQRVPQDATRCRAQRGEGKESCRTRQSRASRPGFDAPCRTRTCNPEIRSLVLYPVELRAPTGTKLAVLPTSTKRYDRWLIRDAAAAAPNPLSMFTTVTPDAQELSIASSADTPPNAAP